MPLVPRDLPNAAFTTKVQYERQYGLANNRGELPLFRDEELAGLLTKQLTAHGQGKIASLLAAWIDYCSARSNLPESRIQRIPLIARELLRSRYHRFSHGLRSAFCDLRKPPPVWFPRKGSSLQPSRNKLRPPLLLKKKYRFSRIIETETPFMTLVAHGGGEGTRNVTEFEEAIEKADGFIGFSLGPH